MHIGLLDLLVRLFHIICKDKDFGIFLFFDFVIRALISINGLRFFISEKFHPVSVLEGAYEMNHLTTGCSPGVVHQCSIFKSVPKVTIIMILDKLNSTFTFFNLHDFSNNVPQSNSLKISDISFAKSSSEIDSLLNSLSISVTSENFLDLNGAIGDISIQQNLFFLCDNFMSQFH